MSGRLTTRARCIIGALAGFTLCIYCFTADAASLSEVARSLNIDKAQISVSGISSGGFMAHQFHIAHSSNVMGAGIVAGGPYYCAEGSIANAITKCSKFMALECGAPMTGLAASFTDFCKNPYTGPRTDEQSIGVAQQSFATAATWSNQGSINPVAGLSRARVYLFTGLNDEIVPYDVMNAVYHFYADRDKANLDPDSITLNRQFPAHHTMVTDNYYSASAHYVGVCNVEHTILGDPYIGDCKKEARDTKAANGCDCTETSSRACSTSAAAQEECAIQPGQDNPLRRKWPDQGTCEKNVRQDICQSASDVDLAGATLMKIYPDVQPASRESLLSAQEVAKVQGLETRLASALSSKLINFSQSKLIEQKFGVKDAGAWASFADNGYLYVPEACKSGAQCRLHVAFHGCKQGGDNDPPFGNIFARFAGYNEWAKNNRMVVLYPQVQAENYWPINPQGCWDWWGFLYTGDDYATLRGKQIKAVAQMINTLVQEDLLEVPTERAGQP
jgi:poly(3-hydroxybutyrate) depolymerase